MIKKRGYNFIRYKEMKSQHDNSINKNMNVKRG